MRFSAFLTYRPSTPARGALRLVGAAGMGLLAVSGPVMAADGGALHVIAQREVQRRESLIRSAEGRLAEGRLLIEKGEPEQAVHSLQEAYESLPKSPATEEMRARLRAAFANASLIWARNLLKEGRFAQAGKAIDAVLAEDMDPGNSDALSLRKQAADPDRYPPALTPAHIAAVKEVTRLLALAASATELGDYDKARGYYSQVIRTDTYNTAARRGLEHLEKIRSRYFSSARDHTRAKQLGIVDSAWEEAVPVPDKVNAMLAVSGGMQDVTAITAARAKLQKKLRELKVPHVEFVNAGLDEVVGYLRIASRNVDPEGRGVDFIVNLEPEARNRQISLTLNQVPLEDLVRYVTEMAGITYRLEANAVVLGSLTERSTSLVTKTYKVPPDFIQTAAVDTPANAPADPFAKAAPAGATATPQLQRMGAKEFLTGRGVPFPEGASASFAASSSTLVVRTTVEGLNLVDTLVEQAAATGAKQVIITVKMVDVSQTRLNELGFDWQLGLFNVPGSDRVYAGGGGAGSDATAAAFKNAFPAGGSAASTLVTGGLRSSGEILGQPSIDGLIASNANPGSVPTVASRTPATFGLIGVNTDPQFQTAIRALSQSKGVDLVSTPSITVKSGQKSSVRVVREFPYPTQFNPPQIPQNITGGLGAKAPITPTTPTAFAVKEVGTSLDVEPVVSPDGRMVEISLTPSDTEFDGFIDYGTPITGTSSTSTIDLFGNTSNSNEQIILQPNHIYQPVFHKTGITTAVNVYDGSTIVLGGLVSDKVTDINDKVPIIGDIPLVGRFWQSKVKQSEKRCVLFYVSVKVIDPGGRRISDIAAQ